MQYYMRLKGDIVIDSPEKMLLLLHMRCFGQAVASEVHLRVDCSFTGTSSSFTFHKVCGMVFDDSPTAPFKKATVSLEGRRGQETVYAVIELDLADRSRGLNIMISPIPFGDDFKPRLPFPEASWPLFLQVAKIVLSGEEWTNASLKDAMLLAMPASSVRSAELNFGPIMMCNRMGLTRSNGVNGGCVVFMTPEGFENIFGVKLP